MINPATYTTVLSCAMLGCSASCTIRTDTEADAAEAAKQCPSGWIRMEYGLCCSSCDFTAQTEPERGSS